MPKRRIVSKTSQNAAPPKCNIPVATETAFDNVKFQKELNWCVEQLRMGMLTKSPN
uniref:Uncharacterized protein n=2 Tax=Ciona intestinalis TaxID=7719 RepID=H2XUZ4_CIOIN